jgi:hypothetical protein
MLGVIEDSRNKFKVKLPDDLEETVIGFLNSKDGGNIKLYNKDKLEFKEELVINKNINKVKYTTCLLEIIKKTVFTMF